MVGATVDALEGIDDVVGMLVPVELVLSVAVVGLGCPVDSGHSIVNSQAACDVSRSPLRASAGVR